MPMGSPSVRRVPSSARADISRALKQAYAELRSVVDELLARGLPTDTAQLMDFEVKLHQQVARRCADVVTAAVIKATHDSAAVAAEEAAIVESIPHLRLQKSAQDVTITLYGGTEMTLSTRYYLVRPPARRGPKRARGKRGKGGNGHYCQLACLGIHYRVTPALASEVGRLVALGTVQQAVDTLAARGVHMDGKAVSRLAQLLGERGLAYREWVNTQRPPRGTGWAKGRRIAVGIDGGRVRTRTTNKGAKRKSGHRGFTATWREPKVLTVYQIDEEGRKERRAGVFYDATLQDADGVFGLLTALLKRLGAAEAVEWVILGDGAPWIWDRIDNLVQELGYDREKVTEVLDFYHACEHVAEAVSVVARFSEAEQKVWYDRLKWLLRSGRADMMIAEIAAEYQMSQPEQGDRILGYFKTHRHRLDYTAFRRRGIPLGSGAVESAVRRLVNLRLKGNGIFWCPENAEAVLHLRAQLLSGTWHDFTATVLEQESSWKAAVIKARPRVRPESERRAA